MKKLLVILALGVLAVSPLLISQEKKPSEFSPYVDSDGAIRRPKEYRDTWTHLGTYMVLNESEAGHGLHEVYTERSNIEAYNKTGAWPDGATIVKEVRHTRRAQMTTGNAHWGTDIDVWFVMVKDRKGRYPNNQGARPAHANHYSAPVAHAHGTRRSSFRLTGQHASSRYELFARNKCGRIVSECDFQFGFLEINK